MRRLDFATLHRGATEGTFRRYELPSLLVRVARQGRTGRLTLAAGNHERCVGFSGGMPTLAGSQTPSERLGQRLLKLYLVTPEQLAQVDALMCREPVQFGEAMLRLGFMREDELRRTLRTHHNWVIAQCLSAAEARSTFAPYVWVAKDPSGLALLQALEDGVRTYGSAAHQELLEDAEGWRFEIVREDVELARRLNCSKTLASALERLQGVPRTAAQLVSACEDGTPEVMAATLVLSGLLRAAPVAMAVVAEELRPTGSGDRPAMDEPQAPARQLGLALAPDTLSGPGALPPTSLVPGTGVGLPLPPSFVAWLERLSASALARRLRLDPVGLEYVLAGALFATGLALGLLLWPQPPAASATELEPPEPPLLAAPPPGVARLESFGEAAAVEAVVRKPAAAATRPAPGGSAKPARASVSRPASPPVVDAAAADLAACARHVQASDYRQAIAACQRVLAIDPRHATAYRYIGICYAKLGGRAQACEAYRRYLRFAGNPPDRAQVEAALASCK